MEPAEVSRIFAPRPEFLRNILRTHTFTASVEGRPALARGSLRSGRLEGIRRLAAIRRKLG
jgi:hypothetical protein